MFNGHSNILLYTAIRIDATFEIPNGSIEKAVSGTAFFVQNKAEICLVTNRHILDIGYKDHSTKYVGSQLKTLCIEYFIPPGGDFNLKPIQRAKFEIDLSMNPVKFAPNYHEDVACIIDPKPVATNGGKRSPSYHILARYLANDTWIENQLSVCDFVAFPGFPPWHDRLDNRPILRTGTIASDPRANYSEVPEDRGRRIAYEAFSFGGSSGSPVFAAEKGIGAEAGVQIGGLREDKLVGINAGHLTGELGSHSGVSYFIKSSAILELIQ